jgi:hypothetical protein
MNVWMVVPLLLSIPEKAGANLDNLWIGDGAGFLDTKDLTGLFILTAPGLASNDL